MDLLRLFKRKKYVFMIVQKHLLEDDEADKKNEIQNFIQSNLKGGLFPTRVKAMDVHSTDNLIITIYCTFHPSKKELLFNALLFEINAFIHLRDDKIFKGYDILKETIQARDQVIEIFRFKL